MNTASNHTIYAHWKDPYVDTTGASRPVLKDELIPVTIASNGTVKRADITEKWYDYNAQEWANAIILLDKNKNYTEGQVIPESNIESYFVWIPRYKYKIFNTGNYNSLTNAEKREQTIEVQFEDKTATKSTGSTVGSWLTHPAFTSFNSNGFWVGKFESGYKDATTTTGAEVNSNDSTKLIIKPNNYSWRNINIGNMFKVSYDYSRNLESHMMKNTEWGAVTYLSHSKYGSRKSVRLNNNSNYLTGYAAIEEPTCGTTTNNISTNCNQMGTTSSVTRAYNTTIGYTASTTENISGIYDMSGGSWEWVMGYNINTSSGNESEITNIYSDFFTNSKWNKYYDKYYHNSTSTSLYSSRILGDATGEMGPFANYTMPNKESTNISSWYMDNAHSMASMYPWYRRGQGWNAGINGGIFSFNASIGNARDSHTFRLVLTP